MGTQESQSAPEQENVRGAEHLKTPLKYKPEMETELSLFGPAEGFVYAVPPNVSTVRVTTVGREVGGNRRGVHSLTHPSH